VSLAGSSGNGVVHEIDFSVGYLRMNWEEPKPLLSNLFRDGDIVPTVSEEGMGLLQMNRHKDNASACGRQR
jgi:hypothetical protein